MTVVKPCSCRHDYQDDAYGAGLRVHNQVVVKSGPPQHRCTVCGSIK